MLQIWYVTYRYLCKIAILVWLLHTVCPRMDAIVDINDEKKEFLLLEIAYTLEITIFME